MTLTDEFFSPEDNTIVVTSIYQPFWGTEEFTKSCDRVGFPVHNAFKGDRFTGNGDVIRNVYEALVELKSKYRFAIYSDGADSIFLNKFEVPAGSIIYSTEKAIWPPTPTMHEGWKKYYDGITYQGSLDIGYKNPFTLFYSKSPWKYLNGGGYCGEISLLVEFFERYGLSTLKGDVNGQDYQALAFLKAREEGFPIYLDTDCRIFQTTGFEDPGDFEYGTQYPTGWFKNNITGHCPSILHGNGRTDMKHLYELLNR